jgi:hypothetical protein
MSESGGGSVGRTILIWLGVLFGLGVLCCGGVLAAGYYGTKGIREEIGELANKTPAERERWVQEKASGLTASVVDGRDAVLGDFFEAIAESRDDDAYALMTPGLRQSMPAPTFEQSATLIRERLGPLREKLILSASSRVGFGQAGSTLDLTYRATFEMGEARLTAQLLETAPGVWRVNAYRVHSELLGDPGEGK